MERLVHVVVVNWNRWKLTLPCLRFLLNLDYENRRIVVIDNGSTDDSVAHPRQAHADLTVIETGRNLGFAGGNNVGIRFACEHHAEYIWLLNNDTTVDRSALSEMVTAAEEDPRIGAVGSVVYDMDVPDRVESWSSARLSMWTGNTWPVTHADCPFDYLSGTSLLLRSLALEQVGLFDERFFFYWEDADLSARLRRGGWRLAAADNARVWHRLSSTAGCRSFRHARLFTEGMVLFMRKHARPALLRTVAGLAAKTLGITARGRWAMLGGTWAGWWDGWCSRRRHPCES